MENFDKVKDFIVKYKINQKMLADLVGLKGGAFCMKMKGHGYHKFTQKQQVEIVAFLKELGIEATELSKSV